MMATDDLPPEDGRAPDAAAKKPPKTARHRSPVPAWPDPSFDDVEMSRALAQVPPQWLLGAFALRGYASKAHGYVADVPWANLGRSDPDHYGTASDGRKVLCTRCAAREHVAWVALRSWFEPREPKDKAQPPPKVRPLFRIGQCHACGGGYWTEVRA